MSENEFLLKDYELKVRYLSDHFQRMWTRFNFFVTIESALISGKFLFASDKPNIELTVAGLVMSYVWYWMGAQDRYLVEFYRTAVEDSGNRVAAAVLKDNAAQYHYVGQVDSDYLRVYEANRKEKMNKEDRLTKLLDGISSRRSDRFSVTRMAAFVPLIALELWTLLLFTSVAMLIP